MLPTDPAILYVCVAFPVLSETFVSNEIRAMRAAGHRCVPVALAPHAGPCQPMDEPFRAETRALGAVGAAQAAATLAAAAPAGLAAAWRFARAQTGLPPRSLMLAGARLAALARRERCTHLHAHFALAAAATAIVAARLIGATVSFTGHGFDVYGHPADLALKLRTADLAIAVCEDMREEFARVAPGAAVRVVPCGIDPTRFTPRPEAPDNGRLLAIGRLCAQKGYATLFEALALLPQGARPAVDIVGGGDLAPVLAAQAAALGLDASVRFLGVRPSDWIAAEGPLYRGMVAPYVIAPDGARDTGPVSVKEAMAMGLPCLASALMGLKDIVAPETGWLVPPGDAGALAMGLLRIGELGATERRTMGEAARRRVERLFTLSGQARALGAAIAALRPAGAPHHGEPAVARAERDSARPAVAA